MDNTLSKRHGAILRILVQEYIRTACPVSSKALSHDLEIGLKAASIRSVMAELEAEGFITRPHASAGSVPTEKSFRLYVDNLLELSSTDNGISADVKLRLKSALSPATTEHTLLKRATRAISELTSCAGVVLFPHAAEFFIKDIRLIPLDSRKVMVVVVSREGYINSKMVRTEGRLTSAKVEQMSKYLSSVASGHTLISLRDKVLSDFTREKHLYDKLSTEALELFRSAVEEGTNPGEVSGEAGTGDAADEVYIDGAMNILDQPEFQADFEKLKRLFGAIEDKSYILKILNKSIRDKSPHIYMGSEDGSNTFEGLSFVVAPYGKDGLRLGTLGVIGPVRMDYSRIIPLVNYTATTIGEAL